MADYGSLNAGFVFMVIVTVSMFFIAFYGGMMIDQTMWQFEGMEHGDTATYNKMSSGTSFGVNLFYAVCFVSVLLGWVIFLQSAHKKASGSMYRG